MRWLLRFFLTDADRQAIDRDLEELYAVRRRADGDAAAERWLRRQRRMYPIYLLADRARVAAASALSLIAQGGRDVVLSARSLARTPVAAGTMIVTIGVGLGATTAAVALWHTVVRSPLPYAVSESLYWLYTDNPPYRFRFSVVDYRALEADHASFSAIAAYQTSLVTAVAGDAAMRVTAKSVTGSYFPLLGQRPIAGRLFDESEDARRDKVVILTNGYWQQQFGGDPGAIGRSVMIDGDQFTIAGVLEPLSGPLERDVALFFPAHWPAPTRKGPFFTMVLGRLAPGVAPEAAHDALRATNRRLFPIWQSSYQDAKASWGLQDLRSRVVGDTGSTLMLVLGAVSCVLLIACANAVNLLLARALGRRRELAIRGALGASRARLARLLLAEAILIAGAAAALGLLVASGAMSAIATYGRGTVPRLDELHLSTTALVWLVGLAGASAVLLFGAGLVPALRASDAGMERVLRSSGRSLSDGPAARRVRRGLVAAEFALTTPLLVAASLVLVSLDRLAGVPIGVDLDPVVSAAVALPRGSYPQEADREAFWKRAIDRVARLPGVTGAAVADSRPPAGAGNSNNFDLEDRPTPAGQNQPICPWVAVSPSFFTAVGLRLEAGRLLDDRSLDQNEVVVDRAWANRFFPGEEVVGRRLHEGGCTTCPWTTVVGVVSTVKFAGLDAPDDGVVYWPFADFANGYLVARAAGDPAPLAATLRQAVRELDPGLAVSDIATGSELIAASLAQPRYLSVLVGVFAIAALILSIVGVYGVMSYFVTQHTRDIGVRLALGGEPSAMGRMVLMLGLRLAVAGVVAGVGAAWLARQVVASVLFDISATDLTTMIAVPAALVTLAALACLIPARRAARLDPASILRDA